MQYILYVTPCVAKVGQEGLKVRKKSNTQSAMRCVMGAKLRAFDLTK